MLADEVRKLAQEENTFENTIGTQYRVIFPINNGPLIQVEGNGTITIDERVQVNEMLPLTLVRD